MLHAWAWKKDRDERTSGALRTGFFMDLFRGVKLIAQTGEVVVQFMPVGTSKQAQARSQAGP